MGRSGHGQAERLQPPGCPRRGSGRAGAAPCPLRTPAGTGTGSGTSGLGSRSALGFGRELPYFYFISVWAVVISVSSVGGWFAFGFGVLMYFFCHQWLRHKDTRTAKPGEEEGCGRCRQRGQVKAGASCPLIAGARGRTQLLLWTEPQFLWLGRSA